MSDSDRASEPRDRGRGRAREYLPDIGGGPLPGGVTTVLDGPANDDLFAGGVPRRWVPSNRQLAAGEHAAAFDEALLAISPASEETRPRRARLLAVVQDLNPRSIPGAKLPLYVLTLSTVLGGWGDRAIILSQPEIQASFGLSVAGLITVQSIFTFTSLALGLPLGYLVDRVRRVWLVRIQAIGDALGNVLMSVAGSVGGLIGGNSLSNGSQATGNPALVPLLTDYFPSRARARVVGWLSIANRVGALVGTGVAGLLLSRYGWRPALLALGLVGLAVAGLSFLLREPVRGGVDRLEMGADRARAAQTEPPPSFGESIRSAFAIRTVRLLAVAGMVTTVAQTPINTVIQLTLAHKFLLSPGQRSLLTILADLVTIPVIALGSVYADRIILRRPRTIMVVFAVVNLVIVGLVTLEATAPTLLLFVVPQILVQVLSYALLPGLITVLSLVVPARIRGFGLQATTPFALVGALMIPIVVQFSDSSSPQSVFFLFIPFLLIGVLLYLGTAATVGPDIRAARAASLAQDVIHQAMLARQSKILVCRDVDVAYEGVQVLFNVDLDVRGGEVVALVGTNGSGKSTLLRAICGLQQAANGAIFYDGRDVTASPAYETARRGLVYMPGGQGVFPALSVRENLHAAASMAHLHSPPGDGATAREQALSPSAAGQAAIGHVLELFPILRERLDNPAGTLSGGEQQMVALGQAFLMRPRLLMIDELSLGLAPAAIEALLGVIRELRDAGVTIILVEQSLNVALTIADRAVFMERGQVQFDGPTEDLLGRPDLVRAVFMGGGTGGATTRSRQRRRSTLEVPETRLRAEGITVDFGGLRALDGVGLSVAAGEVVGIIGPNGAGKTTLFDVLSGYLHQGGGTVALNGRDISVLSPDARARLGLGRAFQNARLFPPLTVRENIAVALERRAAKSAVLGALWAPRVRRSEAKLGARVDSFIELLGLGPYADKFVRELSTGTRRAVEVACQMAAEPAMLLLDEPSSGLAQPETEALGPALVRIVRETGCGMLVIEHDLPLIASISDRLIAMALGRVLTEGSPPDVLADPGVLASYLAASHDVIERSGSRVGSVLASVADHPVTATAGTTASRES
ncbi:MAG: MFS transporter [Mycobacteriales bacterium]